MAEAALTFLLQEVKDVLRWYKDLLSGAENEFQQLNDDLSDLKAFLRDAANKTAKEKEEVYKEMERQIREVVYDVEDTIDTCLTKAAAAKKKRTRIDLAADVRSLREAKVKPMLVKVREGFAVLGAAHGGSTTTEQHPSGPKKDQTIRRDKVVGFEDVQETLISFLTEEKKRLDVISVIGMPGLGKTTIACKIFENEKICFSFPVRIWIYVSQRFNIRDLCLNILRNFTSNDMSDLSIKELTESVRTYLSKEKFFLLMDDMWSPEDWSLIKDLLPFDSGSSKVMITSRDEGVGARASIERAPYNLRFFKHEESWELLQLEVFGDVENCPPEVKEIGERIATQCDGVPLTVVVIGGILLDLYTKPLVSLNLESEWENVSQNVNEFAKNDPEKRISQAVELSYNKLPGHLRECFLYLAAFPEEQVIPSWMLTRLWIAEGFVQRRGKSLEEAAEENMGDLVSRNLLMLDAVNPMGEIKTCRVHDMIRVFCTEIAMEQNLFQEIRKNKEGILEPPASEVPKFHRLSFHSDLTEFFSKKPKGPRIRSFLCFYKEPINLEATYISAIPDAFLVLRVLESLSIKFHQFPAKVTRLIHLRYVTLNIDALTSLPKPLSRLWNIQTLVIETKSRSITMKANIWKMYRMRHLKMKAAIVLDDKRKGEGGENLQTLCRLAPESCTANMCRRACNLKELGIRGNLSTFFRTMSMESLGRLEKLKLMNDLLSVSDRPVGLPQRECFPPNLKRLTLSNTFLEWKHISTLAKINSLEVLKLKQNSFKGPSWDVGADVFGSLKLLLIINADISFWVASAVNFPSLRSLVLKNCEKLEEIPAALGNKLGILDIERLRKSAVDSAKNIERVKRSTEKQNTSKWGVRFKLVIGPGCEK